MALSISVVTGSMGSGGGGVATAINGLYGEMTRVSSASISIHCSDGREVEKSGARVVHCPTVGPRKFGLSFELNRSLAHMNADIVHVHGLWSYGSIAASSWSRAFERPIVLSSHGMLDAWALNASAIKKRLALLLFQRRHLSNADCLHALNHEEAGIMRNMGLNNPIAIIPNGVDLPKASLRKDVARGPKQLLFLGRIHPKKGLEQLIRAWDILVRTNAPVADKWAIKIVGWDEGGHLSQLQSLVRDFSLADRIFFAGPAYDSDKERLLDQASAFVLPSFSEGQPMAVLEAWAKQIPVFMTRSCNLQIGFDHHAAIEITNEPAEMAHQFAVTLEQEEELEKIGLSGRQLVEDKFSWTTAANQMLEVYQWLSVNGPKPAFVESY